MDGAADPEGAGEGESAGRDFYAGPDGVAENSGTQDSPWDLRSALDGNRELPAGSTLWLLSGTYDDPRDGSSEPAAETGNRLDRRYRVSLSRVTIRPREIPDCGDPTPVIVRGGFAVDRATEHLVIREIATINRDPVPGGEPTPPGSFPNPAPPGFADWGWSGVNLQGGHGHQVINAIAEGGASGFSAYKATGTLWYGNIAYGLGWKGEDRLHGHAVYFQNPSATPEGRLTIRHNLLSTSPKGRTGRGNFAAAFFAKRPAEQNMEITENGFKGPVRLQSQKQFVGGIRFSDNVGASILVRSRPAADSDGFGFGRPGHRDRDLTHTGNLYVNAKKRVENNGPWERLTAGGTRVVKTNSAWWVRDIGEPPALPHLEEGSFQDVSNGGGKDEFRLWPNAHAPNRAHLITLDLDRNGEVAVDLTDWAEEGDRVCVYHYTHLIEKTATLDVTYEEPCIVPLVDPEEDRMDMYVLFKEPAKSEDTP